MVHAWSQIVCVRSYEHPCEDIYQHVFIYMAVLRFCQTHLLQFVYLHLSMPTRRVYPHGVLRIVPLGCLLCISPTAECTRATALIPCVAGTSEYRNSVRNERVHPTTQRHRKGWQTHRWRVARWGVGLRRSRSSLCRLKASTSTKKFSCARPHPHLNRSSIVHNYNPTTVVIPTLTMLPQLLELTLHQLNIHRRLGAPTRFFTVAVPTVRHAALQRAPSPCLRTFSVFSAGAGVVVGDVCLRLGTRPGALHRCAPTAPGRDVIPPPPPLSLLSSPHSQVPLCLTAPLATLVFRTNRWPLLSLPIDASKSSQPQTDLSK